MILLVAILATLAAVVTFLITAFAEGMSDRPVSASEFWGLQWPAILLAFFAAALFVARHFLHGTSITW